MLADAGREQQENNGRPCLRQLWPDGLQPAPGGDETPGMNTSTGAQVAASPAEEELVREHLPLVHHVVAAVVSRLPRHVPRDDLVSAAMLALAQAARSYDASTGVPFDRYATARLRGALVDELRARDWAGRPTRTLGRRVAGVEAQLTSRLGRQPTPEEVAAETGLDAESVHRLRHDLDRATVLNYESVVLHGDAEEILPATGRSPEDHLLERERRGYLMDAVATLPERLRVVVVGYFLEERPMQDIADELGVTESRVSQMRGEALALMRDAMNSQLDPDQVPAAPNPQGVAARRRTAYYAAVANHSDYRSRLDPKPIVIPQAAAG